MIRSRSNPQVRTIRRLRSSYGRRNADLLLLEGPHLATAAAEAGLTVRHLLVTPDFQVRHAELVDRVEHESGTRAAPIDPERLREQADADAPQGIAAIAEPPRTWKTAESTAPPLDPGLHLYADGIQDPGNLGAMARSAEAAGAASLLLSPGTARASHPRALRASAGSLLRIRLWTDVGVDQLPPDAHCPAHAYVPFGLGPHFCQGMDIARRIFVFGTASLANRLRLEPRSTDPPNRNDTAVGVVGPWTADVHERRDASRLQAGEQHA